MVEVYTYTKFAPATGAVSVQNLLWPAARRDIISYTLVCLNEVNVVFLWNFPLMFC